VADWTAGDIQLGGIDIHYVRTGGAKPPLVFVHGMTDDALYWSRVARALEGEYDVIMYDARGHGRSGAPPEGYAPADHAADLGDVIRSLELGRPAVVGHSMGATTVAAAAAATPELLRCIVLVDPPWRPVGAPGDAAQLQAYAEGWRADVLAMQQCQREELVARCRNENPGWQEEDCELWANSKQLVRPQVFSGFVPMMAPWQATAARIACPALLVTGEPRLGGIVTPDTAEQFAQLVPGAQVVTVGGAGHAIHRDQLETCVEVLRRFLREYQI
jgi:pimeloyl-ACP methyl ester carboxylesterase